MITNTSKREMNKLRNRKRKRKKIKIKIDRRERRGRNKRRKESSEVIPMIKTLTKEGRKKMKMPTEMQLIPRKDQIHFLMNKNL